jgi:hypothetical protein
MYILTLGASRPAVSVRTQTFGVRVVPHKYDDIKCSHLSTNEIRCQTPKLNDGRSSENGNPKSKHACQIESPPAKSNLTSEMYGNIRNPDKPVLGFKYVLSAWVHYTLYPLIFLTSINYLSILLQAQLPQVLIGM